MSEKARSHQDSQARLRAARLDTREAIDTADRVIYHSTVPPTETDNPPPTLRDIPAARISELPTQPFATDGIWIDNDGEYD